MAGHTARRNPGRAGIMAAATAALLLLVTSPASATTVTVASVNFRFQPESQTVNVGDVVRWTFAGDPHTVTSGTPGAPDGRFDSGITNSGGSFQVTFDAAGTFRYFCQIHPEQMTGTIVVNAAPATTPKPTTKASPTPRPTPRPTAKPTARPTARPTAKPTATPTKAPAQPSNSAPIAPTTESPTSGPTASTTSSPPESPAGGSSRPSAAASPSPTSSAVTETGNWPVVPILAGAIVIGLLAAGGLALARRSRRS